MKWQAVVDRFEGDLAVLHCFDPKQESRESYFTVELPRQLLPQELKEGDYLTAESARERVTAILERLANSHHK